MRAPAHVDSCWFIPVDAPFVELCLSLFSARSVISLSTAKHLEVDRIALAATDTNNSPEMYQRKLSVYNLLECGTAMSLCTAKSIRLTLLELFNHTTGNSFIIDREIASCVKANTRIER